MAENDKDTFVESDGRDYATLCVCAVRYCLGRRTYMPELVCNIIRKNWDKISDTDLGIILRDIRDYSGINDPLDNSSRVYGDSCDYSTWVKMAADLKSEISRRAKEKECEGGAM